MKKNLVFIALDAKDFVKDIKKRYPDFNVKIISLDWNRNTLIDWIKKTKKEISGKRIDMLVGFSLGAVISLLIDKKNVKELHIFSPAPYFKEVRRFYSAKLTRFSGKKRMLDVLNISKKDFSRVSNTKIFVGSNELPIMLRSAHEISVQLQCKLNIVPEKNHHTVLR